MEMSNYCCDLHVHTTASDGGYPPEELLRRALKFGMQAVAFTDHDTLASNDPGMELGEVLGIRVIPGVELTTREGYHLLGYFLTPAPHELASYLEGLRKRSWSFMCGFLERLRGRGVDVSEEELAARTGKGIPNMCHLLDVLYQRGELSEVGFDNPAAVELFGDPDFMVNYFWEFARTQPFVGIAEAIRLVLCAGGLPVLAHPKLVDQEEVARLKGWGLVGLEVNTPKHDSRMRLYLRQLCQRFDLLPTGGTDYHGRYFDSVEKGRDLGTFGVEAEELARLEERAAEIKTD